MAGADLSILADILKNDYEGPIRRQLNDEILILQRAQKGQETWAGLQYVIPLSYGRNSGTGARAENATLPTAGAQSYKQLTGTAKYQYGRARFSGPSIASARNNHASFARTIRSEMDGLMRDMKVDVARQCYNDSVGTIAVCGATTTSTTVVLDANSNMNLFWIGQKVDIVASADGTPVASGQTISNIDRAGKTITIGTAVTTTSADIVVAAGNYGAEFTGLDAWLGTKGNTVGGINRGTNPWFDPNVLGNGGTARALSLDLMQQAQDAAEAVGGGKISVGITNQGQRRKYVALVQADRRFVNTKQINGGFSGVEYNDYMIAVDTRAPLGKIFFVDETSLELAVLQDFQWMDRDGSRLSRVANEDAYEAVLTYYADIVVDRPAANATLADLTE